MVCMHVNSNSENTPEGRRMTKLDQILLNGNNITMVMYMYFLNLEVPRSTYIFFSLTPYTFYGTR